MSADFPKKPEVDVSRCMAPGLTAAAVREQVEKILAAGAFAASERMSRFLSFAVQRALEGRAAELKEYLVGVEIFDRPPSFDPRIDPIVRVEARRLRAKLKCYYEHDGACDSLLIEFPKGAYVPRFRPRGPEDVPAPATLAGGSIAVLPFTDLSPGAGSEYFSDGLTQELIHALTRVEGLRVVAWTTAERLKGRQEDIPTLARQLGVGTVVMGSVRRSEDRLRILAQLVDARTGHYLWSETYDRTIEDLFAIQEELSRAIVGSLRLKLLGPAAHADTRPARNLEAYDLYLKGRFHWAKRTAEGIDRAVEYFTRAIAIDAQCAVAYAGLADAYTLYADHGLSLSQEVMPKANAAAMRALELDPNLAEAHTSLGIIRSLYDWHWAEAGEHYRRAIELNPGYATGRHWYACDYLALLGRFDEAIAEMRMAVMMDPLSPAMNESLGYVLMLARRYDEAAEQQSRALEIDPHFYKSYTGLGRVYIQKGMYGPAVEMLEKGCRLAGCLPSILGAIGQAYALDGKPDQARATLARLEENSRNGYVPDHTRALMLQALGETGQALDLLEAACARRDLPIVQIRVHPIYDSLRGEPRFAAMVKRIWPDG